MTKVFIVEDDFTIANLIAEGLTERGFEAFICRDFSLVDHQLGQYSPDVIIMDVTLPFYNGFYWCDRIRKTSNVAIIFLSSHTENIDIINAMNAGGDDYIFKPFSMEGLSLKINAVLRRAGYGTIPSYEIRGLKFNVSDATISFDNKLIDLTKNEARILKKLLDNRNKIVTRDEIIRALWDDESFVDDNTLTVNINRLRSKLSDDGINELIITKKGMGYMIHD